MATTEKTWFTKTIARETVEAATSKLLENEEITEATKTLLDNLFQGKAHTQNAIVYNDEGEAVLKRCSYFGGYLPISEFGTVGKDDDGKVKYSHISKAGAKCQRDAKAKLEKAIAEADKQLEVDEDVQAWKAAKMAAVEASQEKCAYSGDAELIESYEDAKASI